MTRRKGFIFTNRRHSNRAIMSTILGIISVASLITVIYLTYLRDGNATNGYGVTGVLITLFSLTGLVIGIITAREKERYRLFSFLGIGLNLLALGGISMILYLGAYL